MVLSSEEITRMACTEDWDDRIVVEPLPRGRDLPRGAASIDFHLGNRFRVFKRSETALVDLWPREDGCDASEYVATSEVYVPLGGRFVLHPGELVLANTLEWFRIPSHLVAYVQGRSVWGRSGLLVVTAAGVQPSSSSPITLELTNQGMAALILRPGEAVGQLFFHPISCHDESVGSEIGNLGARVRISQFSGVNNPILGRYVGSEWEQFLVRHARS